MYSLALRNLFRHRTRSAVALSAIAFSVAILMLAGGFVEWIFGIMRTDITETRVGHIQVMRPSYLEEGIANPFDFLLPGKSSELAALESFPYVKAVAPRLAFSGLISHGESTLSFVGSGVDPDKERIVSRSLPMKSGANLSEQDPDGVLLGEGLADSLGAKPGDRVVILINGPSGGVRAVEATVRGVFATGLKSFDDVALRVPLKKARQLMRTSGAHLWVVFLDRVERTDEVLQQLRARFKDAKLQFVPWTDLADFYTKTVELLSTQLKVVRVMIGAIIVLGISNMLIMNVLERTGEIGTLMAMGSRRSTVLKLFLSEGVLLGVIGGIIGLGIALVLAALISAIGIPMPPPPGRTVGYSGQILVTWRLAGGAFALTLVTTVLASLYPAWKASRLVVVDALRHNR